MLPTFFVLLALSSWATLHVYRGARGAPELLRLLFAAFVFLVLAFLSLCLSAIAFGKADPRWQPKPPTQREKIIRDNAGRRHWP